MVLCVPEAQMIEGAARGRRPGGGFASSITLPVWAEEHDGRWYKL